MGVAKSSRVHLAAHHAPTMGHLQRWCYFCTRPGFEAVLCGGRKHDIQICRRSYIEGPLRVPPEAHRQYLPRTTSFFPFRFSAPFFFFVLPAGTDEQKEREGVTLLPCQLILREIRHPRWSLSTEPGEKKLSRNERNSTTGWILARCVLG